MKTFATVAALCVSMAQAACEADHARFPTFSEAIGQFEYDWEPHTTTTEDGYVLTMFRLAGPIGNFPVHRTASQSVLIMPGLGMSADSWFPAPEHGEPMPIQLYESGYDVWLGNNRGTFHSITHTHHHHEHDAEAYWNWSFAEMGMHDVPAMLKQIKYTINQQVEDPHILHTDKIIYIGYDQGATQILYGLSYLEDSFYKDYLRGAILLAPCTKMNVLQGSMGYHYYADLVDNIDLIGLYGMHGLNWEQFKPDVCAHLGRQWCDQEIVWREEPYSARALTHFFQNGIEGRFQEFADNYLQGKEHRQTADIPIQNISHVPIAVMYGDADRVCPMDSVEWMMSRIGHMVYGNYQFGGYDHADFGHANDSVFIGELHEALSHLQPHEFLHERELQFRADLDHALEHEYQHEYEMDQEHLKDIELGLAYASEYEFDSADLAYETPIVETSEAE